jgi:hypothetical protein
MRAAVPTMGSPWRGDEPRLGPYGWATPYVPWSDTILP